MHNYTIFVHKKYIKIAHFSKFEQLKMARREGAIGRFLNEARLFMPIFMRARASGDNFPVAPRMCRDSSEGGLYPRGGRIGRGHYLYIYM